MNFEPNTIDHMAVSENWGPRFGSPENKGPTVLGAILGPLSFGNFYILHTIMQSLGALRAIFAGSANLGFGLVVEGRFRVLVAPRLPKVP